MGYFKFNWSGETYQLKTMMETETRFFVDPENEASILDAWHKYRQEQEDIAFQNQPPELFKFYSLKYWNSDGSSYSHLIGAESEENAIALLRKFESFEDVEVVKSYEKFCNFASLTDEEVAAQMTWSI